MTVRIGIIGPGGMGKAHIDRIVNELAGGQLVAVFDVDAGNAAAVAEPLGATVYATTDELISAADVDAVMITSGGQFHEADLIKAIQAGKPVFCEKPLTKTADAAIRVMEAEQAAGRKLVTVGFMRRFDRSYNEMKAILDARELGEAILVHNRHRNPTVPESYTADMAINDTAIHEIDTMRWLLGEEIVKVRVDKPKKTTNRFPHLQDPLVVVMQTDVGRAHRRRGVRQHPVRLRHPVRAGARVRHGRPVGPERHQPAGRPGRPQPHDDGPQPAVPPGVQPGAAAVDQRRRQG